MLPPVASRPPEPMPSARPVLMAVVQQHAEEAALLRHQRSVLVRAPHVGLLQLGRLDERIAAHLDGLAVAGAAGTALCVAALEQPGAGEVFALAVRALESRDEMQLAQLLALAEILPDARRGLASALGWVSAAQLQGVVRRLLDADAPHAVALGLTACRLHRVDPGLRLAGALDDHTPVLRAAALQAAGALGRTDLLPQVRSALVDASPEVVLQAARAACLLGERQASPQVLAVAARQATPEAPQSMALALAVLPFDDAAALARSVSATAQAQPADALARRRLVRALGLLGDPRFVPWLIERMTEPPLARLAGEAFSWITGADLARLQLETLTAPPLPEQPNDDPLDDNVALDEDHSLPWPDIPRIQQWWAQASPALPAAAGGQRLFMGQPPGIAAAREVLAQGTQRQRAHAATLLCLLQPGRPLFPVAAPARRQQRWLAGEPA